MSIHSRNDAGHSRVRPEEAGVPHRREHADDARIDWPDDRPRSGDDARLRRLRRQHHVGQHLAAASAEHQAAGLRTAAGRRRAPRRPTADAGGARSAARAAEGTGRAGADRGVDAAAVQRQVASYLGQRARRAPSAPTAAGSQPGASSISCAKKTCRQAIKAGAQDRDRRAHDRHAGGARPRRSAPRVRHGRLAADLSDSIAADRSVLSDRPIELDAMVHRVAR